MFSVFLAEWSLIIFTTFAQFAAGTALFAGIAKLLENDVVSRRLYISSFVLIIIAGIASVLHLSNVFNAFYTITQIGHSWLSREIVSVGLFSALVFLQVIKPSKVIASLASIAGLLMVFAISKVYISVEAMPLWSNASTYFAFFGTALLLGGAYTLMQNNSMETNTFKKSAYASIILGAVLSLGAKLNWINVFLSEQNLQEPINFSADMFNIYIHIIGILVGILIFLLNKEKNNNSLILFVAMAAVFIAEISSRTIFFASQFKIGV